MQHLEGLMVETGRVIQGRYLLQRFMKQGQFCTVHQAFDQILQRAVAVKSVPAEHIATYRAALRQTSQFSHPNIIGVYDIVIEPEALYIVEELVDGDDFSRLLQQQHTPYEITDLGKQICQALIYASTSSRKVVHGDLTPSAVLRDRRGQVRITNFALPSNMQYFTGWCVLGGDNRAISDTELPWGKISDGRRDDDARAVGLLLYQLLSGRAQGATSVEPPTDGYLRFHRNVPPELCEVIARAVIRQHPQHIADVEMLHAELKVLAEAFEPPPPPMPANLTPHMMEDVANPFRPAGAGTLAASLSAQEMAGQAGLGVAPYPSATNARIPTARATPLTAAAPQAAEISMKLAAARQAAYPQETPANTAAPRRINLPALLLLGLIIFAICFIIGYFLSHLLLYPGG
jgi:serine/threonine protein kinase